MIAAAGELKAVVDDGKNAYVVSKNNPELVRSANDLVYAVRGTHRERRYW
jgi:hypothetical protein